MNSWAYMPFAGHVLLWVIGAYILVNTTINVIMLNYYLTMLPAAVGVFQVGTQAPHVPDLK